MEKSTNTWEPQVTNQGNQESKINDIISKETGTISKLNGVLLVENVILKTKTRYNYTILLLTVYLYVQLIHDI